MAMLPLKASRKEHHSVIHFLWAKCHSLWDASSIWCQAFYKTSYTFDIRILLVE